MKNITVKRYPIGQNPSLNIYVTAYGFIAMIE